MESNFDNSFPDGDGPQGPLATAIALLIVVAACATLIYFLR